LSGPPRFPRRDLPSAAARGTVEQPPVHNQRFPVRVAGRQRRAASVALALESRGPVRTWWGRWRIRWGIRWCGCRDGGTTAGHAPPSFCHPGSSAPPPRISSC